ncbi:hypothetical protein D3248_11100 [Leucobacter zeae]|nr:hypothetical protein [Leucobacter zeae]
MAVARMHRTKLAFGAAMTAAVAVPLSLTACASAHLGAQAVQLHASADSDMLAMPTEQTYAVSEVEFLEPDGIAALHSALGGAIDATGRFVVGDGMITDAELDVAVSDLANATFVLTEPTMLRSELGEAGAVTATGVLTVDGVAQQHAKVRVVPVAFTEDQAQIDVSFAMPDNPIIAGVDAPFDQVAVRLTLTAE